MRAVLVMLALLPSGTPLLAHATITGGPSGDVASSDATFTFDAEGGAVVQPTGFECRVDGAAWNACSSPDQIGGLGGGPHTFEVRATGVGVDGTPDHRDWTVAEQTQVTTPTPNPVVQRPKPGKAPRKPKRRDARGCAYGANQPGEAGAGRLRAAIVCLVNVERAARQLQPVRRSGGLERSARGQVRDMLKRRYFAHVSPSGSTLGSRDGAAGYLRGARYWTVGEVLAWITKPRPTPDAVVRAWMHSPEHQRVLLTASFRDAGVYVGRGNPVRRNGAGATFAMEFGRRD